MADASSDPFATGNPFAAIGFADGSVPAAPGDDPSALPPLTVTRGASPPPPASPAGGALAASPTTTAPTGASAAQASGAPTGGVPPGTASDPFAGDANPFAAIGFEDDGQSKGPAPAGGSGVLANQPGDGFVSGTLKNAGTTVIKGLAHAPGFFGDLSDLAGALGEIPDYMQSKITGEPFGDINSRHRAAAEDWRKKQEALDKSIFGFSTDPRSYFPSGAEVAAPILRQTGAYQPTTTLGRYGSAIGETVLGALGPGGGGMAKGLAENAVPGLVAGASRMATSAAQHAPVNALAGASSQAASDASGGDPLAAALGGIGAAGLAGAAHGAVAGGPTRKAAAVLAQGTADPDAALAAVRQGQADPIPGVQPTTAQLTGDPGVQAMQAAAAGTSSRGPRFDARQQEQSRGLGTALDAMLPGGDPQRVATLFARRFDDIGDRTQALVDGHLATAQAQVDELRGQGLPVDAYGTVLRNHLLDADAARRDAEGELWDAVDPDGKLTNDATGIKTANAQIYGQMPAADRAFMSPAEQTFTGLIGGLNDVEPFRQIAALKSNLASAMRQELSDNGRTPAYARMSRLMGPVQDAIDGSVTRKAAADSAAVAAGTMAPEDTLGSYLERQAAEANARRNAGTDTGARAVGNGASAPADIPAGIGSQAPGQRGLLGTQGPTRIPPDVAGVAPQVGSPAPGAVRPVYHPGGTLGVRNELVEHSDLITSHDADFRPRADYPQNLQPRARESAGARDQVNGMAARLQPERLGPSPEANAGAPIVGPDNVVESGNGRTMAIGKAYEAGGAKADAYRAHLEKLGYDTSGFEKPVLVGRRITPMTAGEREYFTHAANDATALRMGSAEQAAADASKITPAMLDAQVSPNITAVANRPFVGAFMSKLPAAERGALVDGAGNLSQAGVRRIQAAMASHAYGDRGVIARAFDDADPNIKGLAGALTDAAGPWAKMRNAVSDGSISPEHDVTPELMQAVKLAMRARDEGRPIGELLAQRDLFQSDTSRLATAMLTKDGNRLASRPQIEAALRTYAEEALKNSSADGLFGGAAPVNDVLKAAQAKAARETGSTTSKLADGPMFADVPPPPTANMDAAAAARYQAANAATKERARLAGAKPVADVLAESGGRGQHKVPASAVPGKFFTKGPGGFENVQAFREMVGDDQTAMHVLRDHALDDLQRTARTPEGTFDERKLAKWRSDYDDALRAFPELATKFESVAAATRTLNEASVQRRELLKTYEKSIFGKLMNASHPEEVTGIIGAALQRNDRVMVFRKLAKEASADPMALAGLRQAVLEHVVGKSVADIEGETGAARTLKAKQFLDLYQKTHLALREVLGDRASNMLGAIARMAPRVAQSVEGAGKQPKNLMRYLNTAAKPHESLLERMWKPAIALREFGELGSRLGGEWGEMLAGGVGAIAVGKRLVSSMRATGARKVGDLITDALLDPEKYAALLAQAPMRPDTGSASTLAYQLRRASMYGGDAMARVSAHIATRAPRLADRADDQRRHKEMPARATGGRVEPTDAQKEAGNYRKDHVRFAGMDISIENRKGAERSGIGKSGHRWSVTMPAHYGYIRGTTGADGDHVDCYIGPDAHAPEAFVIDQVELPNRAFDEHKVMLGFASEREAVATYVKGFSDGEGQQRIGKVTRMPVSQVPAWARSSAARQPSRARGGHISSVDPDRDIRRALEIAYGGDGHASDRRKDTPARARGGGLFGTGNGTGPLGVPTFGQMFGPGMKAAKAPFASGGTVGREHPEATAARFMSDLQAMSATMKRETQERAILAGLGRDPVAEALRIAWGAR